MLPGGWGSAGSMESLLGTQFSFTEKEAVRPQGGTMESRRVHLLLQFGKTEEEGARREGPGEAPAGPAATAEGMNVVADGAACCSGWGR